MTKRANVVVLGGGYAGVLAAQRLARRAGVRARVLLVNASADFVERIRLHQLAAGHEPPRRPIAALLRGTGAELVVARAQHIDAARRRVLLDDGSALDCDFLLYAPGSVHDVHAVPGVAAHAHRLDSPAAARALGAAARAAAADGGRLVVCGGGLTAIEAATELATAVHGLRVTLVTRDQLGGAAFSVTGRAHALAACARLGIDVLEGAPVAAVEPDAVVLARGDRLAADVCLWAAGFRAPELARASGLPVDALGRLLVDDRLAAHGLPWLLGAGDAAHVHDHRGARLDMSCKTAMPLGAFAADHVLARLAGRDPARFQFGDTGVCVSLGRHDAVIQLRTRAGENRERIYRARLGAFIKEAICRYTTTMLGVERIWPGAYRWLDAPRQLAAPGAGVAS